MMLAKSKCDPACVKVEDNYKTETTIETLDDLVSQKLVDPTYLVAANFLRADRRSLHNDSKAHFWKPEITIKQ